MGDLMRKVERLVPKARCLMAHRGNPHVNLWPYDSPAKRFFDVYQPQQFLKLISTLRKARKEGYTVFGLQMAPGSVQGFFFHLFLKKIKALDFIVDFNLINADIITPPKGNYILDLHLNQVGELLKIRIPEEFYHLELPIKDLEFPNTSVEKDKNKVKIGIHPWSRRGNLPCFVWPFEKWLEVIKVLLQNKRNEIIIFGKDKKFGSFKSYLQSKLSKPSKQIKFAACSSVRELIEIIKEMDLIISVNTGVIHIGYALDKKMIILCGPSLDLWTPKKADIKVIYDNWAIFSGSDKYINDDRFPSISKIDTTKVISCCQWYLKNSLGK
ncbi:glycosyltransferase family 9 protein [Desulfothermus sp.]